MKQRLQCSKCFEKMLRVYVEDEPNPITDVFYCGTHGLKIMEGMELWEE